MNAIELIRNTGMTTASIAARVGCTYHAIRYYETGERFPQGKIYKALLELAVERGVDLTADDFVSKSADNQAPTQQGEAPVHLKKTG